MLNDPKLQSCTANQNHRTAGTETEVDLFSNDNKYSQQQFGVIM